MLRTCKEVELCLDESESRINLLSSNVWNEVELINILINGDKSSYLKSTDASRDSRVGGDSVCVDFVEGDLE